jgi:hypothetical protein
MGRVLLLSIALALLSSAPGLAASTHDPLGLERSLAHPPNTDRPSMLWWWPGAAVVDRETASEITAMKRAGFGSAQIVDLEGYSDLSGPRAWQWGTPDWFARFNAALAKANASHLRIDTAPYPIWMMTSPAVSGPNSNLSSQGLSYGTREVTGPAEFAGPPPDASGVVGSKTLVAVTAAQPAGGDTTLDPRSAVDLSGSVRGDGLVHWSVPAGRWLLFGFWSRPSGQLPNSLYGLVQDANLDAIVPDTDPNRLLTVDPYNPEATKAALGWLDQNMMTPDAVDLFRRYGGELYEDSLEYYYGTHSAPWTPSLLDEFRTRRGYSLAPYLPALVVPDLYTFWKSGATVYSKPDYDFAGGLGVRVRHDYYETLTDLFIEHQRVLESWAHGHGLTGFRHQDYGTTIDSSRAQGATGIPDTESLASGEPWPAGSPGEQQALDAYRVAAGAAHIAGAPAVNLETGDVQGCDKGFCPYGGQPTDYWKIINRAYTAGVTRIQIHGMAYRHVPPTEQGIQPNPWPGWNPWRGIFSEPWAQTWPQWRFWPRFTTYMGRASQLLSHGQPSVDLLFYRDNFLGTAAGDLGNTRRLALDEVGYTYDFTDPVTLVTQGSVRDGRLFPDGAGYKALVVDGADSWVSGMPGATAAKLAELARAGLPIVFVGPLPAQGTSARDPAGEDATVREAVAAMLALPNVRHVDGADAVLGAVADLGIAPDAAWSRPVLVRSVHRRTATRDVWYLFNDGDAPARFTASLATQGTPYAVDLWDNTTAPVGEYQQTGATLQVPLRLEPEEATVLVVDRASTAPLHVVATTADSASASHGRVTVADSRAGIYRTALSNGKTRAVRVGGSPAPLAPSRWRLHVTEFAPKGSPTHDLAPARLKDWQKIPALKNIAGTGTYSARFTVPASWLRGGGVELTLGRVYGASSVSLNGRRVTAATVRLPGDRYRVGELLHSGTNTITVQVATPPLNALRGLGLAGHAGYGGFASQPAVPAGLVGPVTLTPYRTATVAS